MNHINKAFIDYYTELLGEYMTERKPENSNIVRRGPLVPIDQR